MSSRVVTFGEVMGRIAPAQHQRFTQALPGAVEFTFGGGEANVAVSLAIFGQAATFVTALPNNPIGDACLYRLRGLGVDTTQIVRGAGRLGLYYLETGANQRASNVVYDRDYSSLQPGNNGRMDASGGDKIFNDNTGMFVKRVIAVSQGAGLSRGSYEEDGTYMRGCTVSGAQVATTTTPNINWQSWSSIAGYVDQGYTGYSPGGKDRHIPGTTRNATGAHYIVDFPNFTQQQRDSVFASRYDSERVDINLEKHVKVTGRLITPKAR